MSDLVNKAFRLARAIHAISTLKGILIKDRKPHSKSNIQQEIFRNSILPTLIIVTLIGCVFSGGLYYLEMSKAQSAINRTNRTIDIFIEEYFTEIIDTLNTLSDDTYVSNAMSLDPEIHQRIRSEYLPIRTSNNNFAHVYSGYENGLMLINDYVFPQGYDPTIRPWYQNAMDSKPNISIGRPYQDINTGQWHVATSKALQQLDGEYKGVVSIDASAHQIGDRIARLNEYDTEYSFIIDKNNEIVMHPEQSLLNTSLQDKVGALQLQFESQGYFTYPIKGVEYLAYYRNITATGWVVITAVEKKEIVSTIVVQMMIVISLTVLVALFLGWMQSRRLSKRLSRPLLELSSKIKSTIDGTTVDEQYVYPNNEIGLIADEIGQLAEKEIKAKTHLLQESRHQYHLLIENSLSAITSRKIVRDDSGIAKDYLFQSVNAAYCIFMGLPQSSIVGHKFTDIRPGVAPPYLLLCDEVVKSGEPCSFEHYSPELEKYFHMNVFRTAEDCFATIFMDITERKQSEWALRESEKTYKTIMEASPDSTVITDISAKIIMSSAMTSKMFGYSQDELQGMSVLELILPYEHGRSHINQERLLLEDYIGPDQYRAIRKDGSCFDIDVNSALIRDHEGVPDRFLVMTRDITSRQESENKIKELLQQVEIERDIAQKNSQTDGLTGLNNRRFFDEALNREFAQHKRFTSQLSLLMLDVDYFKKYNDHYGHIKGDQCLQQIADALREVVARATDVLARYGGEEFVIIAPNTNRQGAEKLAGRISQSIEALCLPHVKSEISQFVTVSIGIATVTEPVLSKSDELLALADKALYHAKDNGRNGYQSLVAKP